MMKKTLIFVDAIDALAINEAIKKQTEGFEIYLLGCDGTVGICRYNHYPYKWLCRYCHSTMYKKLKPLLRERGFHYVSMSEIVNENIIKLADSMKFDFSSVKELKGLTYKGVDIGYAAFSTYVSKTRNITPSFNDTMKSFITELLRSEVRIYEALQSYIESLKPDLVVVHNGRYNTFKPVYQIARNQGIDYILTEHVYDKEGNSYVNNFYNTTPHTQEAIIDKMNRQWESADNEKWNVTHKFFENRRYGRFAGDKIYTANQKAGQLPQDFDKSKINIAIFNSSEDEYFSVSKDLDDKTLFANQYEALKAILEYYRNDKSIQFYLRIHPNLANIPWKSHQLLYKLNFENLTIIPPHSTISSYTLMESCDKVIVFNSTMGLESVYWGKPVIALNHSYYNLMKLTYVPSSFQDLISFIDEKDLACKKNDDCLKAAYFLSGNGYEPQQYCPDQHKQVSIGPMSFTRRSQFRLLGSSWLYGFVFECMPIICAHLFGARFFRLEKKTNDEE